MTQSPKQPKPKNALGFDIPQTIDDLSPKQPTSGVDEKSIDGSFHEMYRGRTWLHHHYCDHQITYKCGVQKGLELAKQPTDAPSEVSFSEAWSALLARPDRDFSTIEAFTAGWEARQPKPVFRSVSLEPCIAALAVYSEDLPELSPTKTILRSRRKEIAQVVLTAVGVPYVD